MTDLVPFTYEGTAVRTVVIDGDPWFVLTDLCKVLGLANVKDVRSRLTDGVDQTYPIADSLGRIQQTTIVSEPGMYEVVIRSDKPEAVAFRRWITGTVLPQIRKTGSYAPPMDRTELLARAVLEAADAIKEKDARIAELAPAADAWEHLVDADGDYSVREAAHILARAGVETGERRLFARLRTVGWTDRTNRPYQRHIQAGRVCSKMRTWTSPEGEQHVDHQVRITAKGLGELLAQYKRPLQVVGQ